MLALITRASTAECVEVRAPHSSATAATSPAGPGVRISKRLVVFPLAPPAAFVARLTTVSQTSLVSVHAGSKVTDVRAESFASRTLV